VPKATKELRESSDAIKAIEEMLSKVQSGEIPLNQAHEVWKKISQYKDDYVNQINEQSWHTYAGNAFQRLVFNILQKYISDHSNSDEFKNISVLSQSQLEGNDYLYKKLSVRYGKISILPDTDMAIVEHDFSNPWNSEIIAIISCKTSLRERIAQACYWKLKLWSSPTTKNVQVYLATTDNDKNFELKKKGYYEGKTRNRIIAEWELDGIYILRGDFKRECESEKVKQYDKIFNDLMDLFKKLKKAN